MREGKQTVSVVVPHFEDLENLKVCLDALEGQTYPQNLTEIIVADNNSPSGLPRLRSIVNGRAKIVLVTKRGAGPARNGGVAASKGAILAFIDSDCVAEPEWLVEGVSALQDCDIVGGHVDVSVANPAKISPSEAFEKVFAFDFERYITKKGFSGTGNLFVPRSTFDHVGGFRDTVSEDVEWSHRARGLGYRIGYAPRARVAHPARRNWPELQTKLSRVNKESWALHQLKGQSRAAWIIRSGAIAASAVFHTPRVLFTDKLTSKRDRLSALMMLYRSRLWRAADRICLLGSASTSTESSL